MRCLLAEKEHHQDPNKLFFSPEMSVHSCHASHMPLPILYAHSNWHTLEALSNQAKLAACCRFWQIWAFQISSQLSGGVFCVLITSHFGTVHCRASGSHGEMGTQLRHSDSGWWQKPGEDAVERKLPCSMPGMTAAVVERARDSPGGAEEKGKSELKGEFPAGTYGRIETSMCRRKQKTLRVSMRSVFSLARPFWDTAYGLVSFVLYTKSLRRADHSRGKDRGVLEGLDQEYNVMASVWMKQ